MGEASLSGSLSQGGAFVYFTHRKSSDLEKMGSLVFLIFKFCIVYVMTPSQRHANLHAR